jgi:indolepyruvate ferredoxin oxidoreductase
MNAPLPEHIRKALETVTLDDKYSPGLRPRLHERRAGAGQAAHAAAPARRAVGKNTAGFISGYRGSPLGGYDQALWKAASTSRRRTSCSSPA